MRALVLTHAHSDHVGFAERIRADRHVPVRVHAGDEALARGEIKAVRDAHGPGFGRISPTAIARFALFGLRNGFRVTPILEVGTFADGSTLDVPGTPRVVHVPGHTAGSVALHVPSRDTVFVGDAFVTRNVMTGRVGPHFAPQFNADNRQAVASLAYLEPLGARLALPGHGDPWTAGIAEAIRLVRESAPVDLRA